MDMMPRPARWNAELVCGADFVTKSTLFAPSGVDLMCTGRRYHDVKPAPYMGVGLNLVSRDIRSIDTHHEASSELSRSSEGDDVASQTILPVHKRHSTPPVGTKPLK